MNTVDETAKKIDEILDALDEIVSQKTSDGYVDCVNQQLIAETASFLKELKELKYRKRESFAMLPCKCGCKRREHWYICGNEDSEMLKCSRCGFTVRGKNAKDVIRQWNKTISEFEETTCPNL